MKQTLYGLALLLAVLVGAAYAQEPALFQRGFVLIRGHGNMGPGCVAYQPSGSGSYSRVCYATTTLTASQVTDLNSTPVTVIAATGSGTVVDVIGGSMLYEYGTAAFTVSDSDSNDLRLFYADRVSGPMASATVDTYAFLDQTTDEVRKFTGTPNNTEQDDNAAIVLTTTGLDVSSGTGSTLKVTVLYRVDTTEF